MMKIYKTLLVSMLVCALMLAGCVQKTVTDPTTQTEPGTEPVMEPTGETGPVWATAEEVLGAAGLTAGDLTGVDIDAVIAAEQITSEVLGQISPDALKEALLELVVPETDSCAYLIYGEAITLAEDASIDMTQVKRIAVVSVNDTLVPSLMIDMEAGKAYYSDGFFFEDIASAVKITDLTDELRNKVTTAVEAAGIDSWEYSYTDNEETMNAMDENSMSAAATWMIAFETADGVIQYSVYGVDTNAPQEFFDLGVQLYNLFW